MQVSATSPLSGLHVHVSLARNAQGMITDHATEGPFTCISCNKKVVFRKTHKRTRHHDGATSTFDVRGHFFHTAATSCGESWMHKTAKILLVERPAHPFQSRCGECGHVQAFDAIPHGRRVLEPCYC